MGNPAARMGDTANNCGDPVDAPTGTVIAAGTVMINGIPAAKQGDQIVGVDTHIIMIPSPGGPIPTPLPHPFSGMIDNGLSSSVKIMGMPAATVNSTATNTPSHIPQGGPFQKPPMNQAKIIMGSPNVMIGNGGGGGGGGSAGGSGAGTSATQAEDHFLDVKVVDKGGKPVTGVSYTIKDPEGKTSGGTVTGSIEKRGVPDGSHEIKISAITKVAWSASEAAVGDKVKLEVETVGVDSGEEATLEIFVKDAAFADLSYEKIETKVDSDKIEHEWELQVDERLVEEQEKKEGLGYSSPYYYFVVETAGLRQRSGLLRYKDWIELELKDDEGEAIGGAEYMVKLPNGRIVTGKLDDNGYAKVENVPPGKVEVEFDAG